MNNEFKYMDSWCDACNEQPATVDLSVKGSETPMRLCETCKDQLTAELRS